MLENVDEHNNTRLESMYSNNDDDDDDINTVINFILTLNIQYNKAA